MGVMRCNRSNCENIMCERYSEAHGYLCRECYEELVGRGVTTAIHTFMSEDCSQRVNVGAAEAYFGAIFIETAFYG